MRLWLLHPCKPSSYTKYQMKMEDRLRMGLRHKEALVIVSRWGKPRKC